MDIETLELFIERPDIHRRILSGYVGPYSLGIGEMPGRAHVAALVLHVERDLGRFPREITVNGEVVPVVVETGFVAPHALATSR